MLTAIGIASTTFGVSVLAALIPVISIELFVIGIAIKDPSQPWWVLALLVALGQVGGKLLHYYAAQGIITLPKFLRRGDPAKATKKGRWREWLQRFRNSCQNRPVWTNGVMLFSAATSLPPYAATAVVAGWARVPVHSFVVTSLVGRFARFALLLVAPGVVAAWL